MSLESPNNEQFLKILEKMSVAEKDLEKDIIIMQEWFEKQPHLPSPTDTRRLRWYLLQSRGCLEDAKKMVDAYYTIRSNRSHELFRNRDPLRPELLSAARSTTLVPLPHLTRDGYRIVVFKMLQPNIALRHSVEYAIMCMMSADIRILEDINAGTILLIDLTGFTAAHLATLTMPLIRKYAFYMQNIYKNKVKGIHVINASPLLEKLSVLLKPFFKDKVYKRMTIHSKDTKLLELFSQDTLPEDYGGTLPPLAVLNELWLEKLISYRDWFKDEENKTVDETKRPLTTETFKEELGIAGSFRKLDLD